MAITVTCQACHFAFRVKDEFAGKTGKCPKCAAIVRVQDPVGSPASSIGGSPSSTSAKTTLPSVKSPTASMPTIPPPTGRPLTGTQAAAEIEGVPAMSSADATNTRRAAKKKPRNRTPVWIWFAAGGAVLFGALSWAVINWYGSQQAMKAAAEQREKTTEDRRNRAPFNPDAAKAGAADPDAIAPNANQSPDAKVAPPTGS